eukprot:CAMPEP_0119005850 /NCGR_PEP_ID=MMETSP1176-20130426/1960_1 /TAXON_ID=265551 /ORGANISM="Synedropsis recta cf, Strain CCMP1620" /LENGTH=713 /DNA_ID=CAMNT_0006957703 /DNA_START=60 /DNA_END=2201 /DNA_ORIENTATION=-
MLGHWLERGLGQILAPDEKIAAQPKEEEANASFWSFVAPDPVWEASQHGPKKKGADNVVQASPRKELKRQGSVPPPSAFGLTTPPGCPKEVVCQHCHHVTPVIVAPSTPNVHQVSSYKPPPIEFMSPLEKQVLVAAKGTAASILSPSYVTDTRNKVFRLCASSKPLQEKLLQRLRKFLVNDPDLLASRASNMGNLVPDGLTPLMACAYVNQLEAAKLILELDAPLTKRHVDMQGRTALHIAAEMGSLDVVRLLQSTDTLGASAPVDLVGHTPLGRAVTSHQKPARRAQTQLAQVLFSPGDKSICGKPTPLKERVISNADGIGGMQKLPIGFAQMPGFRINMEDALSIHSWEGHALVGVCDGHGDAQQVSLLVADQVKEVFQSSVAAALPMDQRWVHTCLELDTRVKASGCIGGSTGVWALITESTIVVANVGDCRCILVQEEEEEKIVEQMDALRIEGVEESKEELPPVVEEAVAVKEEEAKKEGDEAPPKPPVTKEGAVEFTKGGEQTSETAATPIKSGDDDDKSEDRPPAASYSTKALTTDHKPEMAWEQARIEKAGLTVVEEIYYDEHGLKQMISKIQLAEGHRMAVARSFGDFEYKSNPNLGPEDQAVCVIPEVKTHTRSTKDMYLVLACDGIWDVMSNEEVGDFVVKAVDKGVTGDEADLLPKVGDLLLDECLAKGSKDNLSVVVVALSGTSEKVSSSGVLGRKALDF